MIGVYVDDILIASKHQRTIGDINRALTKEFDIVDLGDAKYCLGVEFVQRGGWVVITQKCHLDNILNRFGMSECKPVATPVDIGSKLFKKDNQSEEDLKLPYRELVGALTYLSTTTRPDIAFAVSRLGQFNNSFGEEHWKAAKRVLRYLKGTSKLGLTFGSKLSPLTGLVDADWCNCPDDRRSFTGYVFLLNSSPVSWDAKKQRTVALSSMEAEYMPLSECVKEAMHLKRLLQELAFGTLSDVTVRCDNKSALKLAENTVFHARSKHIDIRHHILRETLS